MTPFLSKISGDFDGLFGIFFGQDGVDIGNQAYDLGLTKKYKWAGDGAICEVPRTCRRSATRSTASPRSTATSRCFEPPLNTPYHNAFFDEAVARLKKIDPSGPLPDRYVQSNFEAMNCLKLGIEKSKFQGRADTMKLIEALEGLEMKEGYDFPQGDKMLRKEDHQAFVREFIYEVKDGKLQSRGHGPEGQDDRSAGLPLRRRLSDRLDAVAARRRPWPRPPRDGDAVRRLLRTEDLTIRFGGLTALNGVNFAVARGEIRAIIGPNGAGKSTFFNCLTGVLRPTSGRICLNGEDDHRAAAQPHLAEGHRPLVPDHQHPAQRDARSKTSASPRSRAATAGACSPTTAPTATSSTRPKRRSTRSASLGKAEELAANLSHGEQRTLEIAIALATEPQLLCLDEPTAGMSAAETHDTMELVRRIAADLTILIVEHDMQVVMGLAQRITVLHYGEILAEGTPAEIQQNPRVLEVYLKT